MEAIESLFEPVVIYNNQPGKDAKVLKRYNEPSWNYQVVRFLDSEGKDLIPRKDRVWTQSALAGRMIEALDAIGAAAPGSLHALVNTD